MVGKKTLGDNVGISFWIFIPYQLISQRKRCINYIVFQFSIIVFRFVHCNHSVIMYTRWWFQIFLIFIPTWQRFPM